MYLVDIVGVEIFDIWFIKQLIQGCLLDPGVGGGGIPQPKVMYIYPAIFAFQTQSSYTLDPQTPFNFFISSFFFNF